MYGTPAAPPTGILAMAAWLSLIALRDFSSLCETFFARSKAGAPERGMSSRRDVAHFAMLKTQMPMTIPQIQTALSFQFFS